MNTSLKLPRFNGWMLPDDALEIVVGLVNEHRPSLVVEAGSGRSTAVIGAAIRDLWRGDLVALEHQAEFCERTAKILHDNDLDDYARVRFAPIEVLGGRFWYALERWSDLRSIDMLVVDGPPGHTSPLAREPALPLLLDRLSPGAVVVLDDTHRKEEQQILGQWKELVPGFEPVTVKHSTGALSYGVIPGGKP